MSRLSNDDLLKTVFVSGIPKSVSTALLEKCLELIPGFANFERPPLYDGSPSKFGFARFSTAAGVSQALRILPTISLDKENPEHLLTVSAAKSTQEWLAMAPGDDPTISQDPKVTAGIIYLLSNHDENLDDPVAFQSSSTNDEDKDVLEVIRRSLGEDKSLGDIEIPEGELPRLKQEIKKFREGSLAIEKKREQDALNYEKKSQDRLLNVSAFKTTISISGDEKLINVDISYKDDEYDISPGEDGDFEVERRKEAKIRDQLDAKFADHEKKWLHREKYRAEAFERESRRAATRDSGKELSPEEKQARIKKYAEFNEEDSNVQRHMEYFYNHAEWAKARMDFRRRENELDERDERDEAVELAASGSAAEIQSTETDETSAGKISLSLKASKRNAQPAFRDEDAANVSTLPKRLPAVSKVDNNDELIKKLEASIPAGVEALSSYQIKWVHVDEGVLEDVIRPAALSNVVEFLGVEEEDLIDFVVSHVREHKPLQDLVTELEETLDEDAAVLGENIWRLLILESEKRAIQA